MKSLVNLDTKERLQKLLDNLSCLINFSSLELPEVPEVLKCKVSKGKKVSWSLCLSFEINVSIKFHQEIKWLCFNN